MHFWQLWRKKRALTVNHSHLPSAAQNFLPQKAHIFSSHCLLEGKLVLKLNLEQQTTLRTSSGLKAYESSNVAHIT